MLYIDVQTPCVICGDNKFKKLYSGKDRLHGISGEFILAECLTCGLICVQPHLTREESEKYYPSDYISFSYAIEDEKNWLRRLDRGYGLEKRCRNVIKRAGPPGRILDIGCATGIFLNGMQKHGWKSYGVEPNAFAAKYAQERFNLEIYCGYLEEFSFQDNFFDVITLWDVLEHLQDPVISLKKIRGLLKPDGLLVLSLPNANAWERFWFGGNWIGWDVPRHYNIFSPKTIKLLLSKCNFSTKEIVSFTGRHGAMVLSFDFLLSDKNYSPKLKHAILKVLRSIPARIILYPFWNFADWMNRSTIMTVFAK